MKNEDSEDINDSDDGDSFSMELIENQDFAQDGDFENGFALQ